MQKLKIAVLWYFQTGGSHFHVNIDMDIFLSFSITDVVYSHFPHFYFSRILPKHWPIIPKAFLHLLWGFTQKIPLTTLFYVSFWHL